MNVLKRTRKHYLLQYVVLPLVLVGSDIFIAIFSHYSGTEGLGNLFNTDSWRWYFIDHFESFIMILVVAIVISLFVEWLICDIERST